jgi:hypothetical protein
MIATVDFAWKWKRTEQDGCKKVGCDTCFSGNVNKVSEFTGVKLTGFDFD